MLMNVKMATIVGILTFMSRINFVFSWVDYIDSWSLPCFLLWACKKFHNLGAKLSRDEAQITWVKNRELLNSDFKSFSSRCHELVCDLWLWHCPGPYADPEAGRPGVRTTPTPPPPPAKSQTHRIPKHYWSGSPEKSQSYQASIQCLAIIGPPVKHHFNDISLVGLWWPAFSVIVRPLLSSLTKSKERGRKHCQSWTPFWQNFLDPPMWSYVLYWQTLKRNTFIATLNNVWKSKKKKAKQSFWLI